MTDTLLKAQKKQDELTGIIAASEEIKDQRPLFHFATPGGWCNDPNGFSEFAGKIHLFYQYHPYSTQWGPMHWGHVTSGDFLKWEIEPVALAPDSEADFKGCFSGTAIEYEGKHLLAYTGVSENEEGEVQNQCLAFGDGKNYKKVSSQPVITARDIPFDYVHAHFRDPKIWKRDGKIYMICGLKQKDGKGCLVMFESADVKKWTYKGVIDSSRDGLSTMWECPDISVVNGKELLIFSPQEMKENYQLGFHDGNNSIYVSGKLDYEKCIFTRERRPENNYTAALVDYGIDFYAPESLQLSDGRLIMTAWMQAWESYITPENYIWSGLMTLPRELSLKNGRLYQKPVRELEGWKSEGRAGEIAGGKNECIFKKARRHFELDLKSQAASGQINLSLAGGAEKVMLKINLDDKSISFDRSESLVAGKIPYRKAKIRTEENAGGENSQTGGKFKFQIICDTCSLEVFINDGIMTFTNIFYMSDVLSDLVIENGTNQSLTYDFWKIQEKK